MVKAKARHEVSPGRAATKAFERAWKLLGKLENRLTAARADEARRRRQLAEATGPDLERRKGQLDAAIANAAKAAGLLTELSELIAANARAQARQTVSDVAHEAAQAVRAEAQAKTRATAAAGATSPAARPRRRPAAAAPVSPRTDGTEATPAVKPAVKPAAKPVRRRVTQPAASKKPAIRRQPRRSLQPGQPDPDQSSG
jgi:chemotaxis protein histidine kinase CheA